MNNAPLSLRVQGRETWRRYVPLRRQEPLTQHCGVASQNNGNLSYTAVKTWNLARCLLLPYKTNGKMTLYFRIFSVF